MKKKLEREGLGWTSEEDDYLLESYGTITIQAIAKHLKRPARGCRQRYYKLTGTYDSLVDLNLSTSFVADVLGVTKTTINKWIREYDFPSLKFYKQPSDSKTNKCRYNYIKGEDVWKWVRKNPNRVNFSQIKLGVILPEPEWLVEKVNEAKKNMRKRPVAWTQQERDYLLFAYFTLGYSTQEIADHLHRGVSGVCDKLYLIRKELESEGYMFSRLKGRIVIKHIPDGKKHLIKMAG